MDPNSKLKSVLAVVLLGSLAIGGSFILAAPATSQKKEAKKKEASPSPGIPLKFGRSIPVGVRSSGVEWLGDTYYLVNLGSIQFELDKQTNRLKADIKAGVMQFDKVDYDISAAVLDTNGRLLGTARTRCDVVPYWTGGKVLVGDDTIRLDFGVSLDYVKAATFMVSVSRRKVLTPDERRKK